jgi:hypothetical protein
VAAVRLHSQCSAKLSASGEAWADAVKPEIVKSYERVGTTYLKFVVEKPSDFDEVDRAVAEYRKAKFKGVSIHHASGRRG